MKHWEKEDKKKAQYLRDDDVQHGIILLGDSNDYSTRRILSIAKRKDGDFNFMEECG